MKIYIEKYSLLIGVCAALLPVILFRDFTPSNELRYLSIADEAMRNHTFFVFTNHGVLYADKPPLYFWAIMLCRWLTGGHSMWLLTLFSLLPAWGIVQTMDRWAALEMNKEKRMLARMMLLTCGLFLGSAVTLRMDMLMCYFIILSLHEFWKMQNGEKTSERSRWLFPLYLFLAVFTKGPLGLLIPLCSTAVFLIACKRVHKFTRYWDRRTWGILLVCCALWFGAAYMEGGSEYLYNLLLRQTTERAINSHIHAEPFYYYIVCIWYCLAPWSLLAIGTIIASIYQKPPHSSLQQFFLSVCLTTFILLSCISSKLQIYLLPVIPFLIYSAIMVLPDFENSRWMRTTLIIPAAIYSLTYPCLLILAKTKSEELPFIGERLFAAAAVILTVTGIYSLYLLLVNKQSNLTKIIRCISVGFLITLFIGGLAISKLNAYIGYGMLCGKASELSHNLNIKDIRTWQLSRPENMDVYLHCPVQVIKEGRTPVDKGKPYLLLTRKRDLNQFSDYDAHMVGDYAVVVCAK